MSAVREISVAPSSTSSSPSSATRKATAVMLSRPPPLLAASISLLTALRRLRAFTRMSRMSESGTIVVSPSLQSRKMSPVFAGKVIVSTLTSARARVPG